ncbi:MAG: hypothetical protein MK193_06885 [Lentisphaeria bacterium]|nr:hypothetical protein [Lentisphaeria bacterium]
MKIPQGWELQGYDIVSFYAQSTLQCSPLSCNYLANEVEVNENCLLNTLDQALLLTQSLEFANSEPGPYRIIAVFKEPRKTKKAE